MTNASLRMRPVAGLLALAFMAAGFVVVAMKAMQMHRTETLSQPGKDLDSEASIALASKSDVPPERLIRLSQLLSERGPSQDAIVRDLLVKSLAIHPDQPFAWARLSHVEARLEGEFGEAAQAALARSFETCLLCDRELLRWRLIFVLNHWEQVPDDLRHKAFIGADFLRWWHLDYDFIMTQREMATLRGIPFTRYQKAVNSPVRPEEIGG